MQKFIVSRDDTIYEAWPDLAMNKDGRLVCIFSECTAHGNRELARLTIRISDDRGRSWSDKIYLSERGKRNAYFNCARIFYLSDGRFAVVCDFLENEVNVGNMRNFIWFSDDGVNWSEPTELPIHGIVPDFYETSTGRWITAAHHASPDTGKLTEYFIYSDDKGKSWSKQAVLAADSHYNLCEASILEVAPNTLVTYMRENSGQGWDCFKAISYDNGESWEGVYNVPLPGCHRPKAGILNTGDILITHRFLQGARMATQNMFGAVMPRDSALKTSRGEQAARIFPIDYDRSKTPDLGYTGWVQFDDGEIYVVDYIVDDAPKAQIRGSAFRLDEVLLDTKPAAF